MSKKIGYKNDLLSVSSDNKNNYYNLERPISDFYPVIDTDLARDNIENDLTAADIQDL